MGDLAIRVDNLGKRYRIGVREHYKTFRETLIGAFTAPIQRLSRLFHSANGQPGENSPSHIWALKDVSFEVQPGEVVGIIGRNGAGKSTLLRILSRITEPTQGFAEVHGRIGSLLEVGTGFHPELTGRENIYLNGAILGMRKVEIERKFDEMVAFAEVEKFIDTPLKHYSSGMYLRLAFAVAAHLEPEILLVDEVLAVGDAEFQKKCLGKMGQVAQEGRTVLFVSHQMNAIRKLCGRCIWLDFGQIKMQGPKVDVVSAYEINSTSGSLDHSTRETNFNLPAQFLKWSIIEPEAAQSNLLTTLGPVTFRFDVKLNKPVNNGVHDIALFDMENKLIWGTAIGNLKLNAGLQGFLWTLPYLPLRPGIYHWLVTLWDGYRKIDMWECVPEMAVGTDPLTHPEDEWSGILNIPGEFHIANIGY